MINSLDLAGKLAIDTRSVDKLRLQARQDPEYALREAARQFEALFMNMLLKSMREATPKDGMFDSEQTRFYTQMLDQQLAQSLSAKGMGLAEIMIKQLARPAAPTSAVAQPQDGQELPQAPPTDGVIRQLMRDAVTDAQLAVPPQAPIPTADSLPLPAGKTRDFVNSLWSHAQLASQATGIPARFMVAQAALETGWGKHEIRHADGSPSFNLFGIKAGSNWSGQVTETVTTEYVNGVPQKSVEKFRAYSSYAEGFHDYAKLLLNNPRYAAVLEKQDAGSFAHGLQQAGYATDPMYADKLMRILNGSTLRNSLTG